MHKILVGFCFMALLANSVFANDRLQNMSVDELFNVLKTDPDSQQRVLAARLLGWRIERPTPEQTRYLVSAMRSDKSPAVRGAASTAIGKIASHKVYRTGRRRLPYELKEFLNGLRESYRYEPNEFIRIAIIEAVSEFDHNEAQVILNLGKGDINMEVRNASYDAERRRENRLRDSGFLSLGTLAAAAARLKAEPKVLHLDEPRVEKLHPADKIIAVRIVPHEELTPIGRPGENKRRICLAKVYTQYCHDIPSFPAPQRICYWRLESVTGTWNEKRKCCEVFASDGMSYCVRDGVIFPTEFEEKEEHEKDKKEKEKEKSDKTKKK